MSMNNNGAANGAFSNTPPFTSKGMSTCIDYLKVRVNHSYGEDRLKFKKLLEILHVYDYEIYRDKGMNSYSETIKLYQGVRIFHGGPFTITREGYHTSLLEMSGSGCREFEIRYWRNHKDCGYYTKEYIVREGWIKLFEELMSMGGVCTRIDLPTDDFTGNVSMDELKAKLKAHEYTTRLRKFNETTSEEEEEHIEEGNIVETIGSPLPSNKTSQDSKQAGYTATLGSREKMQLCIYDKAIEQHNKGNFLDKESWIRYEVRYYHKNAEAEFPLIYDALKHHKEHQHIVGCLAAIIDFKESIKETNKGKNANRNRTWGKWKEFIKDGEKHAGFSIVPGTPTIMSNLRWLKKDAALSLGKIATCLDAPYAEIMYAFVDYFLKRINKEHLQSINQFLRDQNRKPFESIEQVKAFHKMRSDTPYEISPDVIKFIFMIDQDNKLKDGSTNTEDKR